MRKALLLGTAIMLAACSAQQPQGYHLAKTMPVAGEGGWDFVSVDSSARRVYIAHSTKADVLDADSGDVIGEVMPIAGAHGVAVAPEAGYGFATNGKTDKVTVFDLKTLAAKSEIKTGKKPDGIIYDPATKRVFVFNGGSDSASVINAASAKEIGTIALKGKPEFAVADGHGHVYVNLEDKNEMLAIDSRHMKVMKRWPLASCEEPSSLAMDEHNQRLFAGCGNSKLAVVNAKDGHVITTLPIGEHVDATAFDPSTREIISAAADGTLTVIAQDDADHYHVAQTIKTPLRSKTFGLDEKTHRLFLPSAGFGPATAPSKDNPNGHPQVLPGTFNVLIFDR
ncbi:MAG: YncE family protein [Pseudomonadota bacterium]|nr:YncE family protein [Pseudomonadota bacterium]MDE3037158.1 YncE family protein [Pseudomonadota bacterium]